MKDFKRRRSLKRLLKKPWIIGILAVIFFFLARAAFGVYKSEQISQQELENARRQEQELSDREAFLQSQIQKFGSERGLEEELRTKFPVVKEGEKMVIIVEPEEQNPGSTDSGNTSVWQKFINFFR